MTLANVCTYKRWQKIAGDHDFSPDDIKHICTEVDDRIAGVVGSRKKLWAAKEAGRQSLRYMNKKGYFITVTRLDEQFTIARSARPRSRKMNGVEVKTTDFVIIDDHTGVVVQDLFHWKISGCVLWAMNARLKFTAINSCQSRFLVITGPAENNYCKKKAKMISRKEPAKLSVNKLCIFLDNQEYTPWTMVFDPRVEREDEFLAVCTPDTDERATRNEESGSLIRYSLNRLQITAVWDSTPVSSSSLNIFCGGERVLTVQGKGDCTYPTYRKVLVLNADNLQLLHELPLVPTANISGITPVYSYNGRQLALITWKKFSGTTLGINRRTTQRDCVGGEDEAKFQAPTFRRERSSRHLCPVQVAIYKVPLNMNLISLQELACVAILRHTRPCDVVKLPLPVSLQQMLVHTRRF